MSERARVWRQAIRASLLLLPAVLLGTFGAEHLLDGSAQDRAVPVPVYMVARISMPTAAYASAADALAYASPRNGGAAIELAEARWRAGRPPVQLIAIIRQGLAREPASARGWTLLSEALMQSDKVQAARALSQALMLAPRDYWLVEARAQDAAVLWPQLDADARTTALDQARMLWREPRLRPQLPLLLETREGVSLVARAFAGQPDEIRAMNRWLRNERQRTAPRP